MGNQDKVPQNVDSKDSQHPKDPTPHGGSGSHSPFVAENLGEHRTKPVAVHETFELSKVLSCDGRITPLAVSSKAVREGGLEAPKVFMVIFLGSYSD